jgi:hypothetical protein
MDLSFSFQFTFLNFYAEILKFQNAHLGISDFLCFLTNRTFSWTFFLYKDVDIYCFVGEKSLSSGSGFRMNHFFGGVAFKSRVYE